MIVYGASRGSRRLSLRPRLALHFPQECVVESGLAAKCSMSDESIGFLAELQHSSQH